MCNLLMSIVVVWTLVSVSAAEPSTAFLSVRHPCTVDVLPGPMGVTTHPDRMMSRQSANSCVVLWRDVVTSEWSCARG